MAGLPESQTLINEEHSLGRASVRECHVGSLRLMGRESQTESRHMGSDRISGVILGSMSALWLKHVTLSLKTP